jgi:hypothetical protein
VRFSCTASADAKEVVGQYVQGRFARSNAKAKQREVPTKAGRRGPRRLETATGLDFPDQRDQLSVTPNTVYTAKGANH